MRLLLIYLSITVLSVNSADVYTSINNLKKVLESENVLIDSANRLLGLHHERLDKIRNFLDDARQNPIRNSINEETSIESFVGHPLNAFNLIKRYALGLGAIFRDANLQNKDSQKSIILPDDSDIKGAADAIVRLQRTYRLLTKDLAEGYVLGRGSRPLDSMDCFLIGMAAKRSGDFGIALQWFNRSIENFDLSQNVDFYTLIHETTDLYLAIGNYGKALHTLKIGIEEINDKVQKDHLIEKYTINVEIEANLLEEGYDEPYDEYTWPKHMPEWAAKYEALCRGDKDVMRMTSKTLRCRYVRSRHVPFEYFKQEIFNYKPFISIFHDIISDKEIATIKKLATPELARAKVGEATNPEQTNQRIGKVGWLWDQTGDQTVVKLGKRVSRATGLSTTFRMLGSDSEPFQVVNYGIGGQYEPHTDFYNNRDSLKTVPDFLQDTGDRICTWMFYLSSVEAGGATVFPTVGIRLPPVKNAAAFWYNFEKDGSMDLRTEHAGCPVLLGHKWVANKWIRENGQIFNRPCGKTKNIKEADEYLSKIGYSAKDV